MSKTSNQRTSKDMKNMRLTTYIWEPREIGDLHDERKTQFCDHNLIKIKTEK
jgi:hypothetical protein